MTAAWWVLGWYTAWSGTAFAAFAWDKRAAERGAWRLRERTLHVIEALGGWPGAALAMRVVRHKNRKPAYWLVTALITAFHLAGWSAWIWASRRG